MKVKTLYETDFNPWLAQQIQALQAGQMNQLDRENLEELEGLAASDKRAIWSNFRVLLLHLLKWQYQPERRSDRWRASIRNSRRGVDLILEEKIAPVLGAFYPKPFLTLTSWPGKMQSTKFKKAWIRFQRSALIHWSSCLTSTISPGDDLKLEELVQRIQQR